MALRYRKELQTSQHCLATHLFATPPHHNARVDLARDHAYCTGASGKDESGSSLGQGSFSLGLNIQDEGDFTLGGCDPGNQIPGFYDDLELNSGVLFANYKHLNRRPQGLDTTNHYSAPSSDELSPSQTHFNSEPSLPDPLRIQSFPTFDFSDSSNFRPLHILPNATLYVQPPGSSE